MVVMKVILTPHHNFVECEKIQMTTELIIRPKPHISNSEHVKEVILILTPPHIFVESERIQMTRE